MHVTRISLLSRRTVFCFHAIKPNSVIFIVLETFYSSCSLDRQCSFFAFAYAFLKLRAHLGYSERDAIPLAPCPAFQFFEHFFVDFSVLLIFGVYKNQLSLVVIISNNYINQIVNKILFP